MRRPLTPAMYRALRALALHGSAKGAAAAIGSSEQTVKNHLAHAYERLGVYGQVDALRAVGWLRVPGEDEDLASLTAADVLRSATVELEAASRALLDLLPGPGPASPDGSRASSVRGDDPVRDPYGDVA